MRGLSCGACSHANKPYVTAYEIALKHGFQGTEEEWVKTLQCVYVAKVTGNNLASWSCSDTYEDLVAKSEYAELHLLTLEGRTTFCSEITNSRIVFQSLPYMDGSDKVYDEYILSSSDVGSYLQIDVVTPGVDAITKDQLSAEVQASLDKADTAYQLPGTGVPYADLNPSIKRTLDTAPILYLLVTYTNGNYDVDWDATELRDFESFAEAVNNGVDVRMIVPDGNGQGVLFPSWTCE